VRKSIILSLLLLVYCAAFAGPASAKLFFSLYATGGVHSFANEQDLESDSLNGFKLCLDFEGAKGAPDFSLEGSYNQFSAENLLDGSPLDTTVARVDIVYPLLQKTKWRPFLTVGIGRMMFDGDDNRPQDEDVVAYGAGLKYLLTEYLTLRAEGRHELLFNREDGNIDNYEYTASIGYTFGKRKPSKKKPKPPQAPTPAPAPEPVVSDDDDQDGVKNPVDRCPGTPVGIKVDSSGCAEQTPGRPAYVLPALPTVIAISELPAPAESVPLAAAPQSLVPLTPPPTGAAVETPVSADSAQTALAAGRSSAPLSVPQPLSAPLAVPPLAAVAGLSAAEEPTPDAGVGEAASIVAKDQSAGPTGLAAAPTGPVAEAAPQAVPISIPACSGLPPHAILMLGKSDSDLLHVSVDEVQQQPQPFRPETNIAKKTHVPTASFEFDVWRLSDQAKQVLTLLFKQLQESGLAFNIRVEGHTDSRGSEAYNYNLSVLRANAVATFLTEEQGLDASKISTIGCGEWKPLASNETDDGRTLNRRFELVILPAASGPGN